MNMKILHIGRGFRPWSCGGLIEYAEDLMRTQAEHGYEVHYFFAGRHYPFLTKPKLVHWKNGDIFMHEIINSPIIRGSGDPLDVNLDIAENLSEKFFKQALNKIKPDVIHIQELFGLPSSIIDIIKERHIPNIMALHDYFLLCPTSKLFDSNHNLCMLETQDLNCAACCRKPTNRAELVRMTIIYEFNLEYIGRRIHKFLWPLYNAFKNICSLSGKLHRKNADVTQNESEIFRTRRSINIARLNTLDLLITQSHKTAEIYKKFLHCEKDIVVLHLPVKHTSEIKPKVIDKIDFPINFAVLNGCASIAKGAELVLNTMNILNAKKMTDLFTFHIFGGIVPQLRSEILSFKNVVYHGLYDVGELNSLLEPIDVGIVPSVWEEVYGYVGIEFLAKGIPVIGNKRGGIVDYTIPGRTGWINEDATAEGLAEIMANIIRHPEAIYALNACIVAGRSSFLKTMDQHFVEIDNIYKTLICKGTNSEVRHV